MKKLLLSIVALLGVSAVAMADALYTYTPAETVIITGSNYDGSSEDNFTVLVSSEILDEEVLATIAEANAVEITFNGTDACAGSLPWGTLRVTDGVIIMTYGQYGDDGVAFTGSGDKVVFPLADATDSFTISADFSGWDPQTEVATLVSIDFIYDATVEYPATAISNIQAEDAVEVARYNIVGQLLSAPEKGINIVKYSDGTSKKELVK